MDFYAAEQMRGPHVNLWLVAVFAFLALVLTVIALFGSLSFSVAQQRRDIGLRIALGARTSAILRMVFWQILYLTATGSACGFFTAMIIGSIYEEEFYLSPHKHNGILYGVDIHDPLSFAGTAAILFFFAVIAALLPAFRAARIDPNTTLRCD